MTRAAIAGTVMLLIVAAAGCGMFPKAAVYNRDPAGLPDTLAVLPFTDRATGGRLGKTLQSLQTDLVRRLTASSRFARVSAAASTGSATAEAIVQCTITRLDPQARRAMVLTEVKARSDGRMLLRFVTSTTTTSAARATDYAEVMERSAQAVIDDIAEVLTGPAH